MTEKIKVEVVYASPHQTRLIQVEVPVGATLLDAILQSGIQQLFPEIDLDQQKVGVFSQQKLLTDVVTEGARIEIYRPLTLDPKEARRKRAARQKKDINRDE